MDDDAGNVVQIKHLGQTTIGLWASHANQN